MKEITGLHNQNIMYLLFPVDENTLYKVGTRRLFLKVNVVKKVEKRK